MHNQKEKILSTALCLFYKNGYDGVSINDIAKAVGISKSTMFHYFENKDALFNETFIYCKLLAAEFFLASGYEEHADYRVFIEALLLFAFQHQKEFIFMLDNESNKHITAASKAQGLQINQRSIDCLLRGQEKGKIIALPASMLALILSDIIRDSLPYLCDDGGMNEQHKAEVMDAIIHFVQKDA